MLPLVHNVVVNKKKWMTESEMVDCLAIAQSIPGAVIVNTSTYIGRRVKGFLGSVCATLGVVLPSFICIIILVTLLNTIGDNSYINGFFKGALAAACGLVAVTCVRMARIIFVDFVDTVIAVIVFCLVIFFKVNIVWIIVGSIPTGFILYGIRKFVQKKRILKAKNSEHNHEHNHDESDDGDLDE